MRKFSTKIYIFWLYLVISYTRSAVVQYKACSIMHLTTLIMLKFVYNTSSIQNIVRNTIT
jgi:hypothetical protein